ncbi:helix-turn-helix domain-containing protein [Paracoccus rhizosphaerae]|uniref:Helix-turn-helix domain-containing protein n=1 Tax=Paracoccus rhizosphaerae TaxID=1133347 RepID=A0ABV6CIN3_9RHOB|nr:helix-turn-helix domain-containing protein [Paracoccus rhizosphaerae]
MLDGSLRTATAAQVLGLSQRQVQRLIREVRADGAMAVRHKLRGRLSNNRISDLKRDYVLSLPGRVEERRKAHQADHGADRSSARAPAPACLPINHL